MAESTLITQKDLGRGQAMRWNEDGVVHHVEYFWDDHYPEMLLGCGRHPKDVPTIGVTAELPAVSCLLCLHAEAP